MGTAFSPKLRLAPLWPAIAALIAGALTAIALLPEPIREEAAADLERTLELAVTALPAPDASLGGPDEPLQESLLRLAAGVDYRVTVVALDGVVLADTDVSFADLATIENHGARHEIAAALDRGSGTASRRSATTGVETVYAAKLVVGADGSAWVVRLARPIRSLAALRSRLVRIELMAALLAALVAWMISVWLTRSLFRPLGELIETAEALAAGTRRGPIAVPEQAELAALARALERMAEAAERQLAAVAAERDHLRSTVASMSEGVLVVDERGRPEIVNPAFRDLFGVPSSAPAAESLDLAREPRLAELIEGVLGSREEATSTIERLEPAPYTVALLATPLADSRGAVIVARDLSESERLHQMRRDFVANVSHELRTPLAAIRGYAETMVDGAVDDRATALRFSERILAQCRRLGELLDDLLTLARLESTESLRTPTPVDLVALAQEALELIAPRAEARRVAMRLIAGDPVTVAGEEDALLRLLSNLLDNAVKYNREGGHVELRIGRRGGDVVLDVEDGGIGIPPAHLPRIFERFYRVDAGRARGEGGTGLGLAIVKHVAQAHSGRVEVDSELGRGSTFRVLLPAAD